MAEKPSTETQESVVAASAETQAVAAEEASGRSSSRVPVLLSIAAIGIAAVALAGFWYLLSATGNEENEAAQAAYLATLSSSIDRAEASLRKTEESLARTEASLRRIQGTVSELADNGRQSNQETAALRRQIDSRLQILEPVPGQILRLQSSFSALQGMLAGVHETWLLAETEYYMQVANAQLQLANNPQLAILALNLADDTLQELTDPALMAVRRVLSNELQALEATEEPDVEGAALTLASLANTIESLPLLQASRTSGADPDTTNAELSGVDRALASFRSVIDNFVTVRRTDEEVRPLLAPEAVYFLRTNLALQLETAQLALLRNEQAIFRQSLEDASAWIEKYYDLQSTPVRSALQTIREIHDQSFVLTVPDISASLRMLRQYIAINEAVNSLEPETVSTPEVKAVVIPEVETVDTAEMPAADGPEAKPASTREVNTVDVPQAETASTREVNTVDAPELEAINAAEVDMTGITEAATVDSLEPDTLSTSDVQMVDTSEVEMTDASTMETADIPGLEADVEPAQ